MQCLVRFGLVFGSASFTQEFQSVLEKPGQTFSHEILSLIQFDAIREHTDEAEYLMFICLP